MCLATVNEGKPPVKHMWKFFLQVEGELFTPRWGDDPIPTKTLIKANDFRPAGYMTRNLLIADDYTRYLNGWHGYRTRAAVRIAVREYKRRPMRKIGAVVVRKCLCFGEQVQGPNGRDSWAVMEDTVVSEEMIVCDAKGRSV